MHPDNPEAATRRKMMTLLMTLKADQLAARKSRDQLKASLLTTLIGEAEMLGKNDGNREVTDSEVTALIKKFIKNVDITLDAIGLKMYDADGRIADAQEERRILDSYLPKQLTQEQLTHIIGSMKVEFNVLDVKGKGAIMKTLKERFDGQYDGKMAAQVVDSALK
jgi:uncharacterized protein